MIGSILFNGNVVREQDFIYRFRERILSGNHINPEARDNKKVLLVTGAWSENEFREAHLKEALREIGISSRYLNGFDQNIQNLCVYHEWTEYYKNNPYALETFQQAMHSLAKIRRFYQERNAELVELLQNHTRMLKKDFPEISLANILSYEFSDWQMTGNHRALLQHYACKEIQKTLTYLVGGDEHQARISEEIQEYAKARSGILGDPAYQIRRKELVERILSSNSIFIFGGNIVDLYYSLRFWELQGAFKEALLQGANFYTVSAGSMVLGQKIIVYDDFQKERGEETQHFEFFDNGFGLVSKITLFPHCKDRIQTDDPNNLAYLAHRFQGRVCVGLNEQSFLLLDAQKGEDGFLYPRYTSLGKEDGVYVFDPSGKKLRFDYGEELPVPGSLAWREAKEKWEERPSISSYQGETLWANE